MSDNNTFFFIQTEKLESVFNAQNAYHQWNTALNDRLHYPNLFRLTFLACSPPQQIHLIVRRINKKYSALIIPASFFANTPLWFAQSTGLSRIPSTKNTNIFNSVLSFLCYCKTNPAPTVAGPHQRPRGWWRWTGTTYCSCIIECLSNNCVGWFLNR